MQSFRQYVLNNFLLKLYIYALVGNFARIERPNVAGNSQGASISSFDVNRYEEGFYKFMLVKVKLFANCCLEKGFQIKIHVKNLTR